MSFCDLSVDQIMRGPSTTSGLLLYAIPWLGEMGLSGVEVKVINGLTQKIKNKHKTLVIKNQVDPKRWVMDKSFCSVAGTVEDTHTHSPGETLDFAEEFT